MCNPVSSGEVQSIFHLCISPLSCLLVLWYKPRCVSWLCWYPPLTVKYNSLSDVHCRHTHAESLHLQSQEQRHKEGLGKNPWQVGISRANCMWLKKCPRMFKSSEHTVLTQVNTIFGPYVIRNSHVSYGLT